MHATMGGVSNVDIDGNNALYIKAIQVFISTFETLPRRSSARAAALRQSRRRTDVRVPGAADKAECLRR
jgi:hypothetical protein